jgi:hypothetical protein
VAHATPGREYCPPHRPEQVIARAKKIVKDQVFLAAAPLLKKDQDVVLALERKILRELERTT